MSKQQFEAKEKEIDATRERYAAEITDLETQLKEKAQERDEVISKLQEELSAIALQMKLKEYPKELTEGHQTCSICGGNMRPYKVVQKGKTFKLWACAAGNLSQDHDLVPVM